MKTNIVFFFTILVGIAAVAQLPSTGTTAPTRTSDSEARNITVTNRPGETYSLNRIADQLRELHRVVDQTLPMLNAITETESNSISSGRQQSIGGSLTSVLGNVLRANTNQVAGSVGNTNSAWGNILRGVIGDNANSTASTTSGATTLADLIALREQLQSLTPMLERLDSNTMSTGSTNSLSPTGRE